MPLWLSPANPAERTNTCVSHRHFAIRARLRPLRTCSLHKPVLRLLRLVLSTAPEEDEEVHNTILTRPLSTRHVRMATVEGVSTYLYCLA
jgi:hypothetical protein